MTVLPGCVGCRTVAVLESWTVRDLKERILAETGFPVSEQRLWLGDREVRLACPLCSEDEGPAACTEGFSTSVCWAAGSLIVKVNGFYSRVLEDRCAFHGQLEMLCK